MPTTPNFYLTESQYYQIFGHQSWTTREVDLRGVTDVPGWLVDRDTITLYSSGSAVQPRFEDGRNVVGGFERPRHETRPMKGEPEVNVYGFVVLEAESAPDASKRFPVFMRKCEVVGRGNHWTTLDELVNAYSFDGSHPDDPKR